MAIHLLGIECATEFETPAPRLVVTGNKEKVAMKTIKSFLGTSLTILLTTMGHSAAANSGADANARLAFSDKLGMYSQRIMGSACAYTLDDAPFESRGFLAVARIEIRRILNALEKGDLALGISSEEENEAILQLISEMNGIWITSDAVAQTLLFDGAKPEYLGMLEDRTTDFMDLSFRLVSAVSNQYLDTDSLLFADAIRLQIAGRQRMLSQKMNHVACKLNKGMSADVREELAETIRLFDVSANALRYGKPEAGLIATQDPALLASLDKVDRLWSEVKWPLVSLQSGIEWNSKTQTELYLKLNELTHEMDLAVVAFTKAARVARGGS